MVSYVRKARKDKERKYEDYAVRRTKRNLKALALGRYVCAISKGDKKQKLVPLVFTDEDLETFNLPHANPLIIKLRIRDAIISRVLVDGGNITDITFWEALQRMGIDEKSISKAKFKSMPLMEQRLHR